MPENEDITKAAIALAESWQKRANVLLQPREKKRYSQLARLLANPKDKILLTKLIDQSFRSEDTRRVADQMGYLLAQYGIPAFFSPLERILMQIFQYAARFFPDLMVPKVIAKMRADSSHAIIRGETDALQSYLQERKTQKVRININHLGEAVLGEEEAHTQLQQYLRDLKNPDIEYISVKISTIFSQIHPLAFDYSVNMIGKRLAELYRTAAKYHFTGSDGSRTPKFVNLDMESYRDLAITAAAFMRTLDQPEFKHYFAGMALQAYMPDSYTMLQKITTWARQRVDAGGSPVKIRIVKGANLEMEKIEAAIFDWPLAPYDNKLATDANYKRMVVFGMQPENIKAVRLGIASHNLFELAYAYLTAQQNKVLPYFSFEMLEGMADHVRRAIQETGQEIVLYAPIATRAQFINAISYLIPETKIFYATSAGFTPDPATGRFWPTGSPTPSAKKATSVKPPSAHKTGSRKHLRLQRIPTLQRNLTMSPTPIGPWRPTGNGPLASAKNGKSIPGMRPSISRWSSTAAKSLWIANSVKAGTRR